MKARSDDEPRGWPRGVALVAIAYLAVFLVWVITGYGSERERTVISDIAFVPVGFAAAVVTWAGRRGASARLRRARGWIAVGFFALGVGDAIWFVYEVILDLDPLVTPADIGYLAFYPCVMIGLLALPSIRSRSDGRRVLLDAATVMLSGIMVIWYLVLEPTVRDASEGVLATALSLAYPVGDLLLLFAIVLVLLRRVEVSSSALWLLLAGVAFFVFSDVTYARTSLTGSYAGGDFVDGGWMTAQVLMLVSAAWPWSRPAADVVEATPERDRFRVSVLPYAAIAVAYLLLFGVGGGQASAGLMGLLLGAGLMTAIVIVRQASAVKENARLMAKLRDMALTDVLTNLQSRRGFIEGVERELERAARKASSISLIMIDVDRFKAINDSLGHAVGDAVLVEVGRRCKEQVRAGDLVGRYGGDELTVALPEVDAAEARATAERLRDSVGATPVVTVSGPVPVTLSVGVATASTPVSFDDLLSRADKALYAAKDGGRNRVASYRQGMEMRAQRSATAS